MSIGLSVNGSFPKFSQKTIRYSTISQIYLMAQLVKNPPAMRETWVRSLGWEDPLEKGKATHPSSGLENSPWGRNESDMTE